CFFFFQAEDGIRDRNVTGVQTCALPILSFASSAITSPSPVVTSGLISTIEQSLVTNTSYSCKNNFAALFTSSVGILMLNARRLRSEERRVGKECRTWWGRDE